MRAVAQFTPRTTPSQQLIGRRGELLEIPAAQLIVDHTYQRAVNRKRVHELIGAWDENAFGVLYVSRRIYGTDERFYLIDGQHRQEAVLAMGLNDAILPSFVVSGLTIEEEADIYWRQNKVRLQPGSADTFKARLRAGEPVAVGLDRSAKDYGVEIMYYPAHLSPSQCFAIAALESVYKSGNLDWVLKVIRDGWPNQNAALKQDRILGTNRLYDVWRGWFASPADGATRTNFLIEVMQEHGPDEVVQKAMEFRLTLHSRPATAFARALHFFYNKHITSANVRHKLPNWA